MHYVGFCSVCEEGSLGIRVCASGDHSVVLCDECDALWTSPDLKSKPQFPEQPKLPCPECGSSLVEPPSHWATKKEVKAAGWSDTVKGSAKDDDPPPKKKKKVKPQAKKKTAKKKPAKSKRNSPAKAKKKRKSK